MEENDRCLTSASPPLCVLNLFPQGTPVRLTYIPFWRAAKTALPWASQEICNTECVIWTHPFDILTVKAPIASPLRALFT